MPYFDAGKRFSRKALAAATSFALAFGLVGAAPAAAFADDADAASSWNDAATQANSSAYAPYSSTAPSAQAYSNDSFPQKFDLRDRGVVTPVKFQNPWGTCWGFAAVAASETSILSEMGTTYAEFPLDLSERQLAYFAYTPAPGFAGSQEGEGAYSTSGNPNFMYNLGGLMVHATTMFSAGIGPLYEDMIPYRNEEGIIVCAVKKDAQSEIEYQYLTQAQIDEKRQQGQTVTPEYYASTYPDPDNPDVTLNADWTIDTEDPESKYFGAWLASSYELEESSILPEMATFDEKGQYQQLNVESVNAVKSELMDGRAVSMAFCADTSMPGQQGGATQYISENWAHYTYMPSMANHAVTIVGWDDNYAKENFLSQEDLPDNPNVKQPPANGAWLVKNSWGAETEDFPNNNAWGVEDEQGRHTGYFWVSYYDQSIKVLETFDYDFEEYTTEEEYAINQYNYLISSATLANSYDTLAPSANVFTAAEDTSIRTMTCETTKPNTTVTYQMYLLGEDDAAPDDGELVAEEEETYEFGGFHRMTLPEDKRVPVREGQRYAVVVTQHCNDDGKYYQSVASNFAQMSEEEQHKVWDAYRQFVEGMMFYQKYNELNDKYKSEGMAAEEASARAEEEAWNWVKTPAMVEAINEMTDQQVGGMTQTYYKGVVNEGESFTFTPSDSAKAGDQQGGWDAEGGWTDWSKVVASLPENMVYDNFPIKAFADYRDYADVATLNSLEAGLAECVAALEGVAVSVDGSDVSKDKTWVTQEAYDAFAAAIETARDLMAKAGENYETELSPATPGQEETESAIDALASAATAFEGAQKNGTMEPAGVEGLKQLEDAIKTARNDLQNTKVSADGSDVAKNEKWVSQEAYDAYEAAIKAAEEVVSVENPSQADIDKAAADLKIATEEFEKAKKAGTKDEGSNEPAGPGDQPGLDELKQQFEQAIESALKDLEALKGQASQEAYDAFKKAIEAAQGALSAENPSEADIRKAMDNLSSASKAYKDSTVQRPTVPGKPAAPQFSKTSDPAGHAVAAGAAVAAVAAGVVIVARKRLS